DERFVGQGGPAQGGEDVELTPGQLRAGGTAKLDLGRQVLLREPADPAACRAETEYVAVLEYPACAKPALYPCSVAWSSEIGDVGIGLAGDDLGMERGEARVGEAHVHPVSAPDRGHVVGQRDDDPCLLYANVGPLHKVLLPALVASEALRSGYPAVKAFTTP